MKIILFMVLLILLVLFVTTNPLLLINTKEFTFQHAHTLFELILILIFSIAFCKVTQLYFRNRKKTLLINQDKNDIENKMKEQNSLLDTIFDTTNIGIAILDLNGNFVRVNRSIGQLLGYSTNDLLQMNIYSVLNQDDHSFQLHIKNLIGQRIKLYQEEQQLNRKDGETIWAMATLTLLNNNQDMPAYIVVQLQNITTHKKTEERLCHMAFHDVLTGLANRNKLEQFINHLLATSRRHQQGFALLFMDLDRFKNINDTIGHEAGDCLLQIVAERIRTVVRNTDLIARLGGDEFVILITDVKRTESVALIAKKIIESVMEVIVVNGQEIYLTTSIGISVYPFDGQNLQALMKNADLALYRTKELGRNNYQFYTLEMTNKAQEKMSLQNALGHALAKNEFSLNYQPKMEVATHKIIGVEALLRWNNKQYGYITPDEIIALIEESGLINPVSEWVLKTACQQLKKWHLMGMKSLTLSVNCSVRQFKQANFADDTLKIITEVGLSPSCLEIEVTESTVMQDPENTLRVLYALKDLGMQIAIDDFGTGYWSLGNLRRLLVDRIKIDKSFIKHVTTDETTASITSAIIAMVKKLGIKAIAEGVETREQYEFLVREGCSEIQGYYLTRPLDEQGMTEFLRHPVLDAEMFKHDMTTAT